MIVVYCNDCFAAARVIGDESEVVTLVGPRSEFWPDKFKCILCEKPAEGALEIEVDRSLLAKLTLFDMTAQELFGVQMGLGLPAERGCDLETVQGLLLSHRIIKMKGQNIRNTTRCVLDCIYFEDGTRMYLGSSSQGAVVYRIAKPFTTKEAG